MINLKKAFKLLLIIIFLEVIFLLYNQQNPSKNIRLIAQNDSQLKKYADQVVAKCSKESYRPSCYDREIPKLMDYISMEDAFGVTSIVQDEDKGYPFCHVLGHELSAKEIDKDPSKWKDVVTRCPSGICSNGCIHGGFQERFRAENFTDSEVQQIKPDLIDLCEARTNWHPTQLEQASCYHALGHLMMYITSADIDKATGLCREASIKKDGRDYSHLCFDGVFMQIYQPLEPEDFALIKGKEVKQGGVSAFCANFQGMEKASCLSESWPLFSQEVQKPGGLVAFCSKEEGVPEQNRCFDGMLYVLTALFNFDTDKIHDFCLGLPSERSGQCFASSASRMIETDYKNIDKATALCQSSETDSNKNACFSTLLMFSTYNFHAGSPQFYSLCNGLPGDWKSKCLSKT